MNQANVNRFSAAGLGAALAVLLIWLLDMISGVSPPAEVIIAITTVVQTIVQVVWSKFPGLAGIGAGGNVTKSLLVACCALLLVGCANMANTIGIAAATVDTLAESTADACGNLTPQSGCIPGSPITTQDAFNIRVQLQSIQALLVEANAALNLGDKALSISKYEAAKVILATVRQSLITRGVTP